jgi:predicted ATPase
LFTDVEGSTRLLHELGAEAYSAALAEHRCLIRGACAVEGGVEIDTQGDAFFFAFPTAPGALAAADSFTDALASGPIRVRVGVHTGTPLLTDEGYIGGDVHRAARIAAAGHGGQVLVSASTLPLVDSILRDLGEHRFKDLSAPERVYQLGDRDFPRLKTLYQSNLPIPANPLVGRERELADVLRAVRDEERVVTVTGPGGIGKTRFALAAAAEASDEFPDGVWFVDLTPVRDPGVVLPTIAHAVGIDGDLSRRLRDERCLLLIDNFEQVIAAAADVAELVGASPGVRVLATSREPLRIAAEREYKLPPLTESQAVELFRQRIARISHEIEVDYTLAAEICERLDHLPLAIELAAARVNVLDPEMLLERLESRLPLLVTRGRDVPERQRTLHATIEWSYELLDPDEQRLFRRFAVFRGGATLEAVEAVTAASHDLVESLADKSLVRLRSSRFVMLETIREFARDELDETDEVDDVRRAHAEYFAGVADDANLNAGTLRPGGQRLEIAITEQDNLRAALTWAVAAGRIELGLRMAAALEQFWVANDPSEGQRWFAALLEKTPAEVDPEVLGHALRSYGSAADVSGDHEKAAELYAESLAVFEQLGDERGRATLLHRLGIRAMRQGDLERARDLIGESQAIHERHAYVWGLAQTVGARGAIERDAGDIELALDLVSESAGMALEAGSLWWHAGMLGELASLSLEAGQIDEAERKACESLTLADDMRDYGGRVLGVGVLAAVAADRGDVERAGRLWGAIESDRVGAPLGGWFRHREASATRIAKLESDDLQRALAAGRELSLHDAVQLALSPQTD